MKNIFILVMTIFASIGIAKASSVIIGGFGTDGASGEGMPTSNSVQSAAIIYQALSHLDEDGEATLKTDRSEFSCDKPYSGVSRIEAQCSFMFTEQATLSADKTYVIIEGTLAKLIYSELNIDPTVRIGATTKKVANLSCSQASDRNRTIKCVLTDIIAQEMEIPDDEMGL